jgi:hypothetical protein
MRLLAITAIGRKKVPMKVSVPKPCSKKWGNMTPIEKGRYCQSCQKTVVDFSTKTDFEISQFLNDSHDTCGRFSAQQLNRDLKPFAPTFKSNNRLWPWLLSGLIGLPAVAQELTLPFIKMAEPQITALKSPIEGKKIVSASDTIALSGTVIDERTGEPIPFANVVLKNKAHEIIAGGETDFDGVFNIVLSNTILRQVELVAVSSIGFETLSVTVNYQQLLELVQYEHKASATAEPSSFRFKDTLKLPEGSELMGEVVIMGYIVPYDNRQLPQSSFSDKGLFNSIISWFKKD